MLCPACQTENDASAVTCASCGAVLPPVAVGRLLAGRYQIRSCLGKGGMGVVYQAYDQVLEEPVAIKVLLGREVSDSHTERRFRSEIRLARKVTHRNVCRIHDYGEDRGVPYISMQFVEGTELRARLRTGGGLPPDEACDVALQIAEGLQAVHDAGIVHRDLKTANVMVDREGVVRLMDFGIAKDTRRDESLTATGNVVGTPEYMSPEQIQGEELDGRSDVYSLGVILFELYAGQVPFRAGTAAATLLKQLREEPPLDGPEASSIPPPVREVIRRALAKERAERFGSARELAGALRLAVTPPAAPAMPASTILRQPAAQPTPSRRSRARTWLVLAPVVVVLVLAVGTAVVWRMLAPFPSPSAAQSLAPSSTSRTASSTAPSSAPTVRPAPPPQPTPSPSPETLEALDAACNQGRGTACAAAAHRYESGAGTARDDGRAAALYRRACERGTATGCTGLGVLINNGRGVEKDLAAAAALYEQGCNGGDGAGCNDLGTLYEFGLIGLDRDEPRAAGFYKRGCDLADQQACGNLAVVSLHDRSLAAAETGRARLLARQSCAAGVLRACRALQELGVSTTAEAGEGPGR